MKKRIKAALQLSKSSINIPVGIKKNTVLVAFWILHIDKEKNIKDIGSCCFSNVFAKADAEILKELLNSSLALIRKYLPFEKNISLTGPIHNSVLVNRGLRLFNDDFFVVSMPDNKVELLEMLQEVGFIKEKDMVEMIYEHTSENSLISTPDERLIKRLKGVTYQVIDKQNLDEYIEGIAHCYNVSWSDNWGYSAISSEEFRLAANNLNDFMGMLAIKNNEVVGFTMMSIAQDKNIEYGRAFFSGVLPNYRRLGLSPLLTTKLARISLEDLGIKHFSIAWMLEDNNMIIRTMEKLLNKGVQTKRLYRILKYSIS